MDFKSGNGERGSSSVTVNVPDLEAIGGEGLGIA